MIRLHIVPQFDPPDPHVLYAISDQGESIAYRELDGTWRRIGGQALEANTDTYDDIRRALAYDPYNHSTLLLVTVTNADGTHPESFVVSRVHAVRDANDAEDYELANALLDLALGQTHTYGGGAGALFTARRVR